MEIKVLEPQVVLSIRTQTSKAALVQAIDSSLPAIGRYMADKQITPLGPPYARYFTFTDDAVDVEFGFPVSPDVQPPANGPIKRAELPGGPTATSWHHGKYEGLVDSWEKLRQEVRESGNMLGQPGWEVFWTDPREVHDPADWRTEILLPLDPHQ